MRTSEQMRHQQKSIAFMGLLLFNLVLVLLQLWLFVATLESLIEGRPAIAVPAAISSAGILAVNVWMLLGVRRVERRP